MLKEGDIVMRRPSWATGENGGYAPPRECKVVKVYPRHRWYRVEFTLPNGKKIYEGFKGVD